MKLLREFQDDFLPGFADFLNNYIDHLFGSKYSELEKIFKYHLGLDDERSKQGKRIRPLLTLLSCAGTGTDWHFALPAATAIELIHNFSLIHDDIEDNGLKRRGKDAVWVKWGLAHGLNAGDAMFSSAFDAILALKDRVSEEVTLDATSLLVETCRRLTQGQYLDIEFERQKTASVEEYYEMVIGKTAALISCCTKMGALIGGLHEHEQEKYQEFGHALGIAFQIYDDWLGIWGEEQITGKTSSGDIQEGKKSLPIILGIKNSKRFKKRFTKSDIDANTASLLANWLREDGIEQEVINSYTHWTEEALNCIEKMKCCREVKIALTDLTNKLLIRKK